MNVISIVLKGSYKQRHYKSVMPLLMGMKGNKMIVYNDKKLPGYYGQVEVDEETGKVIAIGQELGREGGWFWLPEISTRTAKEELLILDKQFTGIYKNVKAVAFNEDL